MTSTRFLGTHSASIIPLSAGTLTAERDGRHPVATMRSEVAIGAGFTYSPLETVDCSWIRHAVLPHPEDAPSAGAKLSRHPAISTTIPFDLREPVLSVRSRRTVALRTTVPETSVHEDGDPLGQEGEVRSTGCIDLQGPAFNTRGR